MTKSIRSYPPEERLKVITPRVNANVGGLGTVSAKEAQIKMGKVTKDKQGER